MRCTLCSISRKSTRLYATVAQNAIFQSKDLLLYTYSSPHPIFTNKLDWTFERSDTQVWAVFGASSSLFLASTLLGRAKAVPVQNRTWPLLQQKGKQIDLICQRVKFGTRLRERGPTSGDFTDYTARYGSRFLSIAHWLSYQHLFKSFIGGRQTNVGRSLR